jgi:hypothetical protein
MSAATLYKSASILVAEGLDESDSGKIDTGTELLAEGNVQLNEATADLP